MKKLLTLALVLCAGMLSGQDGFKGIPLGPDVNTPADELMPRFSPDGNIMVFSRGTEENGNMYQRLEQAELGESGKWSSGGNELNIPRVVSFEGMTHEFVGHISAQNEVWTANGDDSGKGASLLNRNGQPVSLPIGFDDLAPENYSFTLGDNERVLIMSYALPKGSQDLWILFRGPSNEWSAPVSLGETLNTKQDEVAPFLSPDGQQLFFTSNGHADHQGGGDIYMSERLDDTWTNWSAPQHLGAAVNTAGWDGHFVLHPGGQDAYFVSGPGPESLGDIYRIPLADIPLLAPPAPMDTLFLTVQQDQPEPFSLLRFGVPNQSAPLVDIKSQGASGTIATAYEAPFFTYTPPTGFTGQESFLLTHCDPPISSNCRPVVVQANVEAADKPDFPRELRYQTRQGVSIPLDMPATLSAQLDRQRTTAAHPTDKGTVKWNSETESEFLRYDPQPDFVGTDTVQLYTLLDGTPVRAIIEVIGDAAVVDEGREKIEPIEPDEPTDFLLYGRVTIRGESEAPGGVEIRLLEEGNRDLGPLPLQLDGRYEIRLPAGNNYLLRSESGLFYPYAETVAGAPPKVEKNIELEPLPADTGTVFTLKNVYFDVGKASLRPESTQELKRLYQFLRDNPTVEVEIRGHTDNQDTEESNQVLSENRVKSVINYLKYQGIYGNRMTGKGFGESQPIDTNETPEGRQNNRRVEVAILKR